MSKTEDMSEHIRQSNLIEGIDDSLQDARSMDAWAWFSKQKEVSIPTLLELHNGITIDQLNKKESGHFRTVPVWIGGHKLMPSPSLSQQLIHNLLLDLKERPEEITPKEAHVRFEKAHPFIDGNGRTGRMLMWWHEKKLGQEPTLIKADERQEYYKWFAP